jgi:hypothetical protein
MEISEQRLPWKQVGIRAKQTTTKTLLPSSLGPSPSLRPPHHAGTSMARIVSRALPFASRSSLRLPLPPPFPGAALVRSAAAGSPLPPAAEAALAASLLSWRGHTATPESSIAAPPPFAGFLAGIRRFRKGRRGQASAKRSQPQDAPPPPPPPPPPPKEREIELVARIGIEEDMPDDPEVLVNITFYGTSLYSYYLCRFESVSWKCR